VRERGREGAREGGSVRGRDEGWKGGSEEASEEARKRATDRAIGGAGSEGAGKQGSQGGSEEACVRASERASGASVAREGGRKGGREGGREGASEQSERASERGSLHLRGSLVQHVLPLVCHTLELLRELVLGAGTGVVQDDVSEIAVAVPQDGLHVVSDDVGAEVWGEVADAQAALGVQLARSERRWRAEMAADGSSPILVASAGFVPGDGPWEVHEVDHAEFDGMRPLNRNRSVDISGLE
jgi:hypothetical protein